MTFLIRYNMGLSISIYGQSYLSTHTSPSEVKPGTSIDCVVNDCSGLAYEIYADLRDWAGFSETYVNLSAAALVVQQETKSPWTACASDVAAGHTDLCVSDFWETASRRDMSDFVTPYVTAEVQVVCCLIFW